MTRDNSVSFVEHDVTRIPLPLGDADLIFVRFLLAHLPRPEAATTDWVTQLRPGGLLLLEEVEWIRTEHPVLGEYLEVLGAMMANRGTELYIGARLDAIDEEDGWTPRLSRIVRLQPTTGQAARMFSMNLTNWREDAFVRKTYSVETINRLDAGLSKLATSQGEGEIGWGLRQIVIERS